MYFDAIYGSLRKIITWQPWVIVLLFLAARTLLQKAAHHVHHHVTPKIFGHYAHPIDFTWEALAEGALTGLSVVYLTVLLVGTGGSAWIKAAQHTTLHAMEHGALECLALTVIFTLISRVSQIKSFLATVPYLQTSIEGILCYEYCREQFAHYIHTAAPIPGASHGFAPNTWTLGGSLHYVFGFMVVGYIVARLFVAIEKAVNSRLIARGAKADQPVAGIRWISTIGMILAGYAPLVMYAQLVGM